MIAVELRGVHTMGCAYLYMVHVVLLRVCTQFYSVYEICNTCAFCSYCYPHRTVIILRNTVINNSLKRSSFSVSDVTDEHNIYLRLFTNLLFARLVAIYSSWKMYSMFPPTYISCDHCCATLVSLFINLRNPRDFTSHTSRRRTLY